MIRYREIFKLFLSDNSEYPVQFHKTCVSNYTSKEERSRHLKRKLDSETELKSPKCRRRSEVVNFSFLLHCITCSYDEILRFQKSAAVATTEDSKLCAISSSNKGMIQTVVDNFDTDISSQNGNQLTRVPY